MLSTKALLLVGYFIALIVLVTSSPLPQPIPDVAQSLPGDSQTDVDSVDQTPAFNAPACIVSRLAVCTPAGVESTIDTLCSQSVGSGKTLNAASQLVGNAYNVAEGYGIAASFTVRATGITLSREECIQTLRFVQEGCVRSVGQCASGQVQTEDGNFVASLNFS